MKVLKELLCAFIVLTLVGCSASSSTATATSDTGSNTSDINVNDENVVEDYVSYKVKGVQAVSKIEPLNTAGVYSYIEDKTEGNIYVDVMLTIKNNSSESIDINKGFTGLISIDGNECETEVGAEDDDNTAIRSNIDIDPLQERLVHFYTDTAKDNADKDIVFTFTANDKTATMKVNLSDSSTMPKKTYSKLGDTVGDTSKCEATFVSVEKTKDISPTNPGSYYSHYAAKDGITYLVLRIDYKNISGNDIAADKIGSMKVTVDSKYKYNGNACLEKDGDIEYMSITSIKPLESAILYYYAEVPDEIVDKTYDMNFYVNSIEYNYTNQ